MQWITHYANLVPFLICSNEKVRPALQTDNNAIYRVTHPIKTGWEWKDKLTGHNCQHILILLLRLLVKGLHKLCQVHDLPNSLSWVHIDELIQIMCASCKTYQKHVIYLVYIRWLLNRAELCQLVIRLSPCPYKELFL